jgi:hypothetical protein
VKDKTFFNYSPVCLKYILSFGTAAVVLVHNHFQHVFFITIYIQLLFAYGCHGFHSTTIYRASALA